MQFKIANKINGFKHISYGMVVNLFDEPQLPTLTHGICGECTASFLKSWTHDGKTE